MADQSNTTPQSKSAAAIVGIVLGIIALVTSFLPIINNLSFILALIGAVFAVVGLVGTMRGKKAGKGLAIASLIVNVAAVVIVLATQSMYGAAIDEATQGIVNTSDGSAASAQADDATADSQPDGAAAGSDEAADKYVITDEALEGDAYTCKVAGVFTNQTDAEMNYVSVSYNLFDGEGAQIGTAVASTSNLAAGGTWKFEAFGTVAVDEVARFELADVTAF